MFVSISHFYADRTFVTEFSFPCKFFHVHSVVSILLSSVTLELRGFVHRVKVTHDTNYEDTEVTFTKLLLNLLAGCVKRFNSGAV